MYQQRKSSQTWNSQRNGSPCSRPKLTCPEKSINKDKVVNSGIGHGMACPVEGPGQQALTATTPHTAGDGMPPRKVVSPKS
jgi:hypothetical protein